MKKIIGLLAACIFIISAEAQQTQQNQGGSVMAPKESSSKWKDKYCASTKDGNTVVMNGKTQLAVDVTLQNGTKVTTDGYIIKKDGTKTALKNGECVDKNGNIMGGKKANKKMKVQND